MLCAIKEMFAVLFILKVTIVQKRFQQYGRTGGNLILPTTSIDSWRASAAHYTIYYDCIHYAAYIFTLRTAGAVSLVLHNASRWLELPVQRSQLKYFCLVWSGPIWSSLAWFWVWFWSGLKTRSDVLYLYFEKVDFFMPVWSGLVQSIFGMVSQTGWLRSLSLPPTPTKPQLHHQ